jgi:signal transduction histidine kinase
LVDLAPGHPAAGYRPLECVLLELVSNALQSSRAGDAITVCGQTGAEHYIFRVCDEGVGLPPDGLSPGDGRPFGQTEPRGFGLAVVQYILRRLGGSLSRDPSGSGETCLRVTLPRGD